MKCDNCKTCTGDIAQNFFNAWYLVDVANGLCHACSTQAGYRALLYRRAGISMEIDDYGALNGYEGTLFEGGE